MEAYRVNADGSICEEEREERCENCKYAMPPHWKFKDWYCEIAGGDVHWNGHCGEWEER